MLRDSRGRERGVERERTKLLWEETGGIEGGMGNIVEEKDELGKGTGGGKEK